MPRRLIPLRDASYCERDALTHALTRPAFLALLRERIGRATPTAEGAVVLLVDIDQLQNVNDQRGQHAGDRVIAALAQRLSSELCGARWRGSEHLLARYDGDALIVLAAPCTLSKGRALAEALRASAARAAIGDRIGVTVSIGVAQCRIGESTDDLLARTERALHLAKQFGRDRVEVSIAPPARAAPASVVPLPCRLFPDTETRKDLAE